MVLLFVSAGHVDSVKFSGDLIAGISLLSPRIMTLTKELPDVATDMQGNGLNKGDINCTIASNELESLPNYGEMLLPRRSLYILAGVARYYYAHAILGKDQEPKWLKNAVDKFDRRISFVIRNIK